MLTRCPHCETTFRVGPEQLKARQGKVRCGECRAVFDALDALIDETLTAQVAAPQMPEDAEPVLAPSEQTEASAVPAINGWQPGDTADTAPDITPDTAPDIQPEPVVAETDIEPPADPVAHVEETVATVDTQLLPEPLPEMTGTSAEWPSAEWLPDTPPAETRRWPWIVGVLTLLVLAVGQSLFIYRTELAMQMPELRPSLVAVCELLGCEVPYPRKGDLVTIETSDLAPEGRDRLQLSATLRNRATFVQAYPHLELTLTDSHDEPILRKVLVPEDYLTAGKPGRGGFAARGELSVKLLLDVKDVPAAGYRLYLFYP